MPEQLFSRSAQRSRTIRATCAIMTIALAAAPTPSFAQPAAGCWSSRQVKINGMGFVTGILSQPGTGDIFAKTDVGGIYRFNRASQRWVPLMDSLPFAERPAFDVESLAFDPASPQRFAVLTQRNSNILAPGGGAYAFGDVLLTTDAGATWNPQGLLPRSIRVGGNKEYRGFTGERLAIDPAKPDRFLLASRVDGVFIRENAAAAWSNATGNPAVTPWSSGDPTDLEHAGNTPGHTFLIVDPAAGTLPAPDGASRRWYLGDHATGVYLSTTAGRTWTLIPGSPLLPVHAAVHSDGLLYVSCARLAIGPDASLPEIGSVHRFDPATSVWTNITPLQPGLTDQENRPFTQISAHPTNPSIIALTPGLAPFMHYSTDRGTTWTRVEVPNPANTPLYNEPPRPENYFATSTGWGTVGVLIDPLNPARVWQTNGYGVVRTDNITAATPTWTWVMDDFEELVFHNVVCPPVPFGQNGSGGAAAISTCMDMVGLRHDSVDQIPTVKVAQPLHIGQANSIAYSYQNPNHSVVVGWDTWRPWFCLSGKSSDNGRTWTPFADTSPGVGGRLAMSATNPQHFLWEPSQWRLLRVTFDGGQTWEFARNLDAVFDPNNTDPNYAQDWWKVGAAWHVSNAWWQGQHLASDKVNGSRFYRLTWGQFSYSTDGGRNWRNGFNSWALNDEAPRAFTIQIRLVTNPVQEGDVWISEYPNLDTPNRPLWRSQDGGLTVARVASVQWATQVAFGKGDSPTQPYIYIHGLPVGAPAAAEGIYVSRDGALTWQLVTTPATNTFAKICALEGDMRIKNRVFAATSGRGMFVVEAGPPSTCPADYNCSGAVSVQDIFDFLAAWFDADPRTDINRAAGVTVQDLFDYVSRWFTGCA
jgi:xyloglucan-specific exo-beta-1,4-glucanase